MTKRNSMRVRPSDIEGALFQPSTKSKISHVSEEDSRVVVIYTIFGQHDYLNADEYPVLLDEYYDDGGSLPAEQRDIAFAKKVIINDNPARYYIKQGSNGKFYNPIGLYDEGRHNKQLKHAGRAAWEFKEVNHKVFNFYLNFLKSKNIAQLTNAEREAF